MMKNLKPFSELREGDWWDSDPSAPWNAPDDPDPEAGIEYSKGEQPFEIVVSVPDLVLLRKKSDRSLWILDTVDMLDTGGDYDDYIYYYDNGEEREKLGDMDDESYANILVDLYKEKKYVEDGTAEGWENKWEDEDAVRLYKLTPDLAEHIIHEAMTYSKERKGGDPAHAWRTRYIAKYGPKYREMANLISRAFPEAD